MSSRHTAALAASLFSFIAVADAPLSYDEAVTVTATRTPVAVADALAPVVVVTGDELRASAMVDLAEALRFVAGIEIGRNGGPGQATSLFLRGTNSNHTQVLIDGVRVNPGTLGAAAIQHIRPADVERIEIVKGPRSTLYGTEAIGGVINVITRRAGRPLDLRVDAGVGADATRAVGAGIAARGNAWYGGVRADRLDTDGYPTLVGATRDRGYDNRSWKAHVGHDADGIGVEARQWHADGVVEYFDFFGAPVRQDFRNRASAVEARFTGGTSRLLLRASRADDEIRQRESPDFVTTARTTVDVQYDVALAEVHEFTFGAVASRERTRALSFGSAFDETPSTHAAFAQWRRDDGENALLVAARRSDHDAFGGSFDFNLEAGRVLGDDWRVVAGVGTAFRAPDASQRFGVGGNPALSAEDATNVEVGLRGRLGDGRRVAVHAYENRIEDLVTFDPVSFTLVNLDRARIRGIELEYTHDAGDWYWRQSFVLQRPTDVATGDPLPRRARRTATSALVWRASGSLDARLDLLATGPRKDSGFSPDFIPGYVLVNAGVDWRFARGWSADLRVENLLDTDYQTALGFRQAGRGAYVGLHWAGW